MKIGVIDTDGEFKHTYFKEKKINIKRLNPGVELIASDIYPFSHAEYVCAAILAENPSAEIILINIIGKNVKKNGIMIINSIKMLIDEGVCLINISLGIEEIYSDDFYKVCEEAKACGVTIVAAHCNENATAYPASFDNVIGVDIKLNNEENKFFRFSKNNNNVYFVKNSMVSFYQLNQEHLMKGNSFLTGRITGLISADYKKYKKMSANKYFEELMLNEVNVIPDFQKYRKGYVICISNRPNDALQKKYAAECFSCVDIFEFDKIEKFLEQKDCLQYKTGTLLIDINSNQYYLSYKKELEIIICRVGILFKHIFVRYPIFTITQRMYYQKKYNILFEQLYL
ncbi:S8 family serine peptidase [Lachnotalea glycerini]|uniref:Peptidase S8/S53 domain-containing protein n=1 Tax=Lachnotalea glycerini TaxID=1763509 RepID=A0A371JC68_9FIRM|nr:S8 family serine peptidase [Lachnotalea glycerini]RDY30267.1 hypothetical protein CG710_015465 [Lachnotalea glycerini]